MNTENRVIFTKEMKKDYTILIPNMCEIHFELLLRVLRQHGYNAELLHTNGREIVDEGLKYVHNDTCYPALLVIGQLINALNSGKYDPHKTALLITQTGGGCRASNYIHLLRKALAKAGYEYVPVISLNLSGLEKNPGFKLKLSMLIKFLSCLIYGDLIMLLKNQVKPYEINEGETDALVERWITKLIRFFRTNRGCDYFSMKAILPRITRDFAAVPVNKTDKIKVGIVGEIYVKYSPLANNHLEDFLISQGCEPNVPGLMGFMFFKTDNRLEDIKLYGGKKLKKAVMKGLMWYMEKIENCIVSATKAYGDFTAPATYKHLRELIEPVMGYGCKMGEGWLLTAEMMELIENGYGNIVCAQPFGCLPNHIVGKGMVRKLREIYPDSNIVPIDYDPGATRVNQENRIKLMLAVAKENACARDIKKFVS
ncbi:MAG: 2-hydroxyacyl-CoA dehydratase [Clostridia bacterium]|nr:2-hydroxyacyl-CoA dehydratase [Clostridia bacterium]